MSIGWLDLVEFFEEFAGVELTIVFCPQTLEGRVNAFCVGSTEKFCQLSIQSMVFFWISTISDWSAEITTSMVWM
jgi:hypothetical protein